MTQQDVAAFLAQAKKSLDSRIADYQKFKDDSESEWGKAYSDGKIDAYRDALFIIDLWASTYQIKPDTND